MLTGKQEVFINRTIAGDSPIDAARVAYPNIKTDSALSTMAHENMMKHDIKQAIDEHRAELSAEVDWDVRQSQKELVGAIALAKTQRQPTAITGAVQAINKMLGLDIDKGYAEDTQPLTPAQRERYAALARAENIRLSKGGV